MDENFPTNGIINFDLTVTRYTDSESAQSPIIDSCPSCSTLIYLAYFLTGIISILAIAVILALIQNAKCKKANSGRPSRQLEAPVNQEAAADGPIYMEPGETGGGRRNIPLKVNEAYATHQ